MGLFGLFGKKKEVELDDNITEGILQFENLNLKLAVIQVLMYDLNLLKPRFDIYGFADEHKELEINTDSYTVIEPTLLFTRYLRTATFTLSIRIKSLRLFRLPPT